jgi:hypothetical protein
MIFKALQAGELDSSTGYLFIRIEFFPSTIAFTGKTF